MAGAGVEPGGGIAFTDATAELQAAGPCGECLAGGGFISGAEFDDVAAGEVVFAKTSGEPFGRMFGDKILGGAGTVVAEGAADDLFHLALVEVDARAESGHGKRICGALGAGRVDAGVISVSKWEREPR